MIHRISSCSRAFSGAHLLAAVALLVAAAPAFAGAGKVTTTVTPLSTNVTYTDGKLTTYVGYTVAVGSDPTNTNTINNIVFTATASATDPAEKPTFVSADGAVCTTTNIDGTPVADQTSISCAIGQLRAGQPYPTFAVFFKTPVKVTNCVPGEQGCDFVKFSGITYYAEQTGGLTSPPQNSTAAWSAADVKLGTSNPTNVKSVVPSNKNVVIFTGNDAVTTAGNPFSTKVNVPTQPKYTTANITLSAINDPNCTNFTTCYQSDLSIPLPAGVTSYSPYLTIILRMDAANIKKGTKVGGVVVYYQGVPVGDCASSTTPSLPVGTPCIANRVYYKNSGVPGWTADLDGDFEWQILNTTNGSYKIL